MIMNIYLRIGLPQPASRVNCLHCAYMVTGEREVSRGREWTDWAGQAGYTEFQHNTLAASAVELLRYELEER